jgi:hypothetical protein
MSYTPENLKRWTRPGSYVGATWEGYYVAPVGRNRDSDCLTASNWEAQARILGEHKADIPDTDEVSPVAVCENHWAVGWVEWVAIHETNETALRAADKLAERLDGYPALDENDWSEREHAEAETVWRDCYRPAERIRYVRDHRSQFDFHGFSDLLGCIRGKYFAGYAGDLLN